MTEAFRYKDSKWAEDRDAEFEAARQQHELYGWPAKHPGACVDCGRPLSAHKELGDCARFSEEKYADTLGWDAGQRGHVKANPYCHDDPGEVSLWKIYEDGHREGAVFKEEQDAKTHAVGQGGNHPPKPDPAQGRKGQ